MKVVLDYNKVHKEYDKLFTAAGIELAELDWIMCEVTGKKRSELPLCGHFSGIQSFKIADAIRQRLNLCPLGYIFNRTEFYGRKFIVSDKVLIPRMDTEVVTERAIQVIKDKQSLLIDVKALDIGTGSGAIAITVQKETDAKLVATDISTDALSVAISNAKALKSDVEFIQSDVYSALAGRKFDVIISNPPYIESDVIETLRPEVKDHEPRIALDGDKDGLKFYREIIKDAPKYLKVDGDIVLEIGYNQADAVTKLLSKDFEKIRVIKDYGGNDRVVSARLKR